MRTILFRGKSTLRGEWVEGTLVHVPSRKYTCIINENVGQDWDPMYFNGGTGCIDGYAEPVHPETVGQFTGLVDINGKKIFEGDILHSTHVTGGTDFFTGLPYCRLERRAMAVYFDKCLSGFFPFVRLAPAGLTPGNIPFEVIGNIHDNPELLDKEV